MSDADSENESSVQTDAVVDADLSRTQFTTVYRLFANPYCRTIINYFYSTTNTTASLTTLADRLATKHDSLTTDQAEKRLHHIDLPKLADHDALTYDTTSRTATYDGTDALDILAPVLLSFEHTA